MHFSQVLFIYLYVLAISFKDVHCFVDPVSLTIGAGVGLGALTGFGFLKDQTYCRLTECCNERSVPGHIYGKLMNPFRVFICVTFPIFKNSER